MAPSSRWRIGSPSCSQLEPDSGLATGPQPTKAGSASPAHVGLSPAMARGPLATDIDIALGLGTDCYCLQRRPPAASDFESVVSGVAFVTHSGRTHASRQTRPSPEVGTHRRSLRRADRPRWLLDLVAADGFRRSLRAAASPRRCSRCNARCTTASENQIVDTMNPDRRKAVTGYSFRKAVGLGAVSTEDGSLPPHRVPGVPHHVTQRGARRASRPRRPIGLTPVLEPTSSARTTRWSTLAPLPTRRGLEPLLETALRRGNRCPQAPLADR